MRKINFVLVISMILLVLPFVQADLDQSSLSQGETTQSFLEKIGPKETFNDVAKAKSEISSFETGTVLKIRAKRNSRDISRSNAPHVIGVVTDNNNIEMLEVKDRKFVLSQSWYGRSVDWSSGFKPTSLKGTKGSVDLNSNGEATRIALIEPVVTNPAPTPATTNPSTQPPPPLPPPPQKETAEPTQVEETSNLPAANLDNPIEIDSSELTPITPFSRIRTVYKGNPLTFDSKEGLYYYVEDNKKTYVKIKGSNAVKSVVVPDSGSEAFSKGTSFTAQGKEYTILEVREDKALVKTADGKIQTYTIDGESLIRGDEKLNLPENAEVKQGAKETSQSSSETIIISKSDKSQTVSTFTKTVKKEEEQTFYLYEFEDEFRIETQKNEEFDFFVRPTQVTEEHISFIQESRKKGANLELKDGFIMAYYKDPKSKEGEEIFVEEGLRTSPFKEGEHPQFGEGEYWHTKHVTTRRGELGLTKLYYLTDGKEVLVDVLSTAGEIPFVSEKFSLTKEGKIAYDGKEGVAENGFFKFADGSGYVREVDSGKEEAVLIQRKGDDITLTQNGQTISIEKNLFDETSENKISDNYARNIIRMRQIAKNNRIDLEDLERKGDNLVSQKDNTLIRVKDGELSVYEGPLDQQGNPKTDAKDFSEVIYTTRMNEQGEWVYGTKRSTIVKDGEASYIEWGENEIKFLGGDFTSERTFTLTPLENEPNVLLYCSGDTCYSAGDRTFYKLKDGKLSDCGEECEKFSEDFESHIEQQSIKLGGPNNRERTALNIFGTIEGYQRGFGSFFSLFMSEDSLNSWRADVDDFMCSTILLGGTDCWTSHICSEQTGVSGDNTLIIENPAGIVNPVAHIEGEQQQLALVDNGVTTSEFLYKFSFGIKNPEDSGQDINFNVLLRGNNNEFLFERDQTVEEGDTFSQSGNDIIVQYSDKNYRQVCLIFRNGFPNNEGDSIGELCNDIVPAFGSKNIPRQNKPNGVRTI